MLKQRLITALCLVALLVSILFFAPITYAYLLLALIVFLGLLEWMSLIKLKALHSKIAYGIFFLLAFWILSRLPMAAVMSVSVAIWILLIFFLYFSFPKKSIWLRLIAKKVWGIFVLLPFTIGLVFLFQQAHHAVLLLFLLLTVSTADSGAYFVGSAFGRHTLAPHISPKKTFEGLLGGLMSAALATGLLATFLGDDFKKMWTWIAIAIVTALFACVGDLFESAMKRDAGIKDSGRLLPGHGGVLDRIDAYTAAVPFVTLMVYWGII